MKTEMQQLEENAKAQYAKERFAELEQYIESLYADMNKQYDQNKRIFKLGLAALGTYFIAAVTVGGAIAAVAWILWLMLLMADIAIYSRRLERSFAKIDGCFETLQVLGILSKDDRNNRKKKFRRFKDNPIERLWAKIKSKMQQEMYGTT